MAKVFLAVDACMEWNDRICALLAARLFADMVRLPIKQRQSCVATVKKVAETSSAFDLRHINEQWGSPPDDIYVTVLRIFEEEGASLCADARAALTTGRRDALVRAAHTLAGAAANVGALHLAASAKALQASAEAGRNREVEPLVAQVEAAWLAVRESIVARGLAAHG